MPSQLSLRLVLSLVLFGLPLGCASGSGRGGTGGSVAQERGPKPDKTIEAEIKRLYDYEHDAIFRRDFAALGRSFPADFVVTNPFNLYIDKPTVMERLRADIIII